MFRSITFEVTGDQRLACEGCEQRVERLLKALPGVRQARAKAPTQTIEVLFDTAVLEPNAVADRLGKAGYQTRIGSSTFDPGNEAGR
jgi:copper chaperone